MRAPKVRTRDLLPTTLSGNVFTEIDGLVNNLFSEVWGKDNLNLSDFGYPKCNLVVNPTNMVIQASVPGLTEKDVSVEWCDGILSIKGKSVNDRETKDDQYLLRELHKSSFCRTLQIHEEEYDVDNISANVENGLLTITLPQKVKPENSPVVKKIPVGKSEGSPS